MGPGVLGFRPHGSCPDSGLWEYGFGFRVPWAGISTSLESGKLECAMWRNSVFVDSGFWTCGSCRRRLRTAGHQIISEASISSSRISRRQSTTPPCPRSFERKLRHKAEGTSQRRTTKSVLPPFIEAYLSKLGISETGLLGSPHGSRSRVRSPDFWPYSLNSPPRIQGPESGGAAAESPGALTLTLTYNPLPSTAPSVIQRAADGGSSSPAVLAVTEDAVGTPRRPDGRVASAVLAAEDVDGLLQSVASLEE